MSDNYNCFDVWFRSQLDKMTDLHRDAVPVLMEIVKQKWHFENGKFMIRRNDGAVWLSRDGLTDISLAEWALNQYPSFFVRR